MPCQCVRMGNAAIVLDSERSSREGWDDEMGGGASSDDAGRGRRGMNEGGEVDDEQWGGMRRDGCVGEGGGGQREEDRWATVFPCQ